MAKQQWTVRIIIHTNERTPAPLPAVWIEQLRYAGALRVLAEEHDGRTILELRCPGGYDSKAWADQNAARMQSFGVDAAAAPAWNYAGNL